MTSKSPTQLMLEAQRQLDIKDILLESLESHRTRKSLVLFVAVDLGVSDVTVYRWCEDLGIALDEYRRPAQAIEGTPEPPGRGRGGD